MYTQKTGVIAKMINADYYSPFNISISKDGKNLYVVAEEADELLVVDTEKNKVVREIKVGNKPHSVILNSTETKAFVSNQWSDNVSVIDLETAEVVYSLPTGGGPASLYLTDDDQFLFVVNSYTSNLSVIELAKREEIRRLTVGNNPTGIQASPDGKKVFVTSRRTKGKPYDDVVVCELTIAEVSSKSIIEHKGMESAYMMENIAFTPEGDLALMPLIRPKNNVPTVQVDRGWMMTNGFAIIEQKPGGRTIQLLIDEPNKYYADPYDIVITPDGKKAFISHSGVDYISVISIDSLRSLISSSTEEELNMFGNHLGLSKQFIIKRIPTGPNPKGLVLSPDGKKLYVAEHLNDKIGIINTETYLTEEAIDLGGPGRVTVARQGKRMLNSAGNTYQTQFSCYTCHPDEHEDGLVYNMASIDMGRNLANTQSLRDIGDTPPFKWNGKNQTIYKQDGMRFSTVLTRTEPFSYENLDALVAYIVTGIPYPPNLQYNPTGELTYMQMMGKKIFERTHDNYSKELPPEGRCITCHPPPYFTHLQMADVGTLAATDDSMLFDTPHLNNIYASSPYLHDGRATTLEEIWTLYGKTEQHGFVNDFTKMDLNYLVEYLKSLRAPQYEMADQQVQNATIVKH
jgi:YVTN family beta-propeller protein